MLQWDVSVKKFITKKIKKIIESNRERDNRASSKMGGRDGAVLSHECNKNM